MCNFVGKACYFALREPAKVELRHSDKIVLGVVALCLACLGIPIIRPVIAFDSRVTGPGVL